MQSSRLLVALVSVCALTLSACGGDDGNDGNDKSDSPSSAPSAQAEEAIDVCASLTVDEVGEALGGPVTVEAIPGGGCNFNQAAPDAPSAAISQSVADESEGGFDAMRAGITMMIDGDVESLEGVGDEAFVVASNSLSGSSVTGAGGILLGDVMVQLTLLQSEDLPEEEVRQLCVSVLTLIASKA